MKLTFTEKLTWQTSPERKYGALGSKDNPTTHTLAVSVDDGVNPKIAKTENDTTAIDRTQYRLLAWSQSVTAKNLTVQTEATLTKFGAVRINSIRPLVGYTGYGNLTEIIVDQIR